MCGIVGYVGKKDGVDILLEGLSSLEYRGYDSAGIMTLNNTRSNSELEGFSICKTKGRVDNLAKNAKKMGIMGNVGIGHTRWATHGEPSDVNSHPHLDYTNTIGVVHNGIIENYLELKNSLLEKGYHFLSQTDTEVIPNLIKDYCNETGNFIDATIKATSELKGSYALAIVDKDNPDEMVVTKKDSPLVIGQGDGEFFIASDIPALLKHTNKVYILEDNEFAKITPDNIIFFDKAKKRIEKKYNEIDYSAESTQKSGYEDFMLKEIYEQPTAINKTIGNRLENDNLIKELGVTPEYIKGIEKIFIVACGTAMNAGLSGRKIIEKLLKIPTEVDIASEFRYRDPIITDKTLVITISQSGETADTLAALRLAKKHNAKTLTITNTIGSTISREADMVMYTQAGPEIAVASTKAYNTQLVALYMLAIAFANSLHLNCMNLDNDIANIADKIDVVLQQNDSIKEIAEQMYNAHDMFFLGRGNDFPVSQEGSLKLKEISYIHSEAYAAGELKHGPIALIEKGTFVVCVVTDSDLLDKSLSNIQEVKTRGAKVLLITNQNVDKKYYDYIIEVPECPSIISPILTVIPTQLLSYYIAKFKSLDVDKPRNLAKSVTVE